jgi:hypothetical protein
MDGTEDLTYSFMKTIDWQGHCCLWFLDSPQR